MKPQVYKDPRPAEYFDRFYERPARRRPDWVYELVRVAATPYLLFFFRARCIDSDKIPVEGPAIVTPNHFSFLDHFFVAVYMRRKVHFMAKSQLFKRPLQFIYTHGGVFPVRRGQRDTKSIETAKTILGRGDLIVMYAGGRPLAHRRAGRGEARRRQARARDRRAGRAHGDRRHRARAQLEAAPVPEGHRPVRRPDPLRAGRGARRANRRRRPRTSSSPRSRRSTASCARRTAARRRSRPPRSARRAARRGRRGGYSYTGSSALKLSQSCPGMISAPGVRSR